jgi:glycosyltransferase involved in cell wall biosynthesis
MNRRLRIALVADTYPPQRTSGAVQLRDLSREFIRQGHHLTVLLPAADLEQPWQLDVVDGVEVLRLQAPRTKDLGYVRRTIGEGLMPLAMRRNFMRSPLAATRWDAVVWYSPSIFHGLFVNAIKRASGCKGYLILRDLFPEWAVDMGLMGRGLPYRFFAAVARYQYAVADVIGVQAAGNLDYFRQWQRKPGRQLEVLENWLAQAGQAKSPIRLEETPLAGRKVLAYAGNMGVAQGLDIIIEVADRLKAREDVGFLFVGRGSDASRLRKLSQERQLPNVAFFDEIDPDQIPDLYAQCAAGIVALDPRHRSHNIPGKFLTYLQSGLPVLACVNGGNDLAQIIRDERVGQVTEGHQIEALERCARELLDQVAEDPDLPARCRRLFDQRFAAATAVRQIVAAVAGDSSTASAATTPPSAPSPH